MKEINKFGKYTTYNIQAAKPEEVWKLIRAAIKASDKLFVNETIEEIGLPDYSTHIPYSSGFVEERFKYSLSKGIKHFLLQKCEGDHFDGFLLEHYCCDFYKAKNLIASINLVQGVLTVNTEVKGMEFSESPETVDAPVVAIPAEVSPQQ